MEGHLHPKDNQYRSGGEANIAKDLEYVVRSLLLKGRGISEGHPLVQT
jgi:hypothetical protein